MRIWLIHVGEPLPIDRGDARQLRMSLLASQLTQLGHEVLWWSSTFDHNHKRQRYETDVRLPVVDKYALYLLKGMPYSRNVSLRRWLNHYQLARRFRRLASTEPTPDVLVCTIPTLELAAAAVSFARQHSIPAILDVRDLWPDAIAQAFPRPVRSGVDLLLLPMQRWARRAIRGAAALTAVSPSYLHWAVSRAGRPRSACDRVFPLGYPRSDVARDAPAAAAEALRKLGVDRTKKIVWFIGIFGRSYDLSTAIRAAHHLARLGRHDVQFVFSGSGDQMERWIREAAGLETVTFTGWVDRAAISYLMSVAWVGLAAYMPEAPQSLPNKLFEYMSAGLPVLSSLGGDAAELLARHRCGLTYRAGDSRHLAESLLVLLEDEGLRAEMAAHARSAYREHYAADMVYAEMADFVLDIAHRGSGTPATRRSGSSARLDACRAIRSGPAITDVAGEPASRTQLARLAIRYGWALEYCRGKDVLEVACGTGQGLGLLGSVGKRVFGGDYSAVNLGVARATYGSRATLVRFDAQALPIATATVDVILLLETLYFLPSADAFMREAVRVLRPGGALLLSVINKDCPDYTSSDLYYRSYGTMELAPLLQLYGFTPHCFGAIPMRQQSARERLLRPIKRAARSLNLIPQNMQSRILLKRLVFGELSPIPTELTIEASAYDAPVAIGHDSPDTAHQVVLCAARLG